MSPSRREFLAVTAAAGLSGAFGRAADSPSRSGVTFSFGTYGMKGLKTEDALRAVAGIGYDGVELAVRPEWDAAPENLSRERRRDVRQVLDEAGLRLTAFMEHLQPSADDGAHAAALDRLERAAGLGRDLSPQRQPLIQTTLGGGRWDEVRAVYRDRLGDWAGLGRRAQTVIAIKPHRGGAMSRPEEAVWLIEQLDRTPWLRIVYDYSHYAFRDMPLEATLKTALPYTAHVAIKDAVRKGDRVEFALPGESGTFDYRELFALLKAGGYAGDVCCEVSGLVWGQPGYDPVAAAKTCYANVAPAFEAAGLRRERARSGDSR
ncbi:MAG TPA: sugar phosphate isomerase/epimerase family protein [Planctomycetaceae bacterium]|nr:sugar phosphate isomerase/epimerase family protein [Planctomycetaceae bacterium]